MSGGGTTTTITAGATTYEITDNGGNLSVKVNNQTGYSITKAFEYTFTAGDGASITITIYPGKARINEGSMLYDYSETTSDGKTTTTVDTSKNPNGNIVKYEITENVGEYTAKTTIQAYSVTFKGETNKIEIQKTQDKNSKIFIEGNYAQICDDDNNEYCTYSENGNTTTITDADSKPKYKIIKNSDDGSYSAYQIKTLPGSTITSYTDISNFLKIMWNMQVKYYETFGIAVTSEAGYGGYKRIAGLSMQTDKHISAADYSKWAGLIGAKDTSGFKPFSPSNITTNSISLDTSGTNNTNMPYNDPAQ